MRRWRIEDGGTTSWHFAASVGRFQFGYRIHRHSGILPDRWVFNLSLTYDRKHMAARCSKA